MYDVLRRKVLCFRLTRMGSKMAFLLKGIDGRYLISGKVQVCHISSI